MSGMPNKQLLGADGKVINAGESHRRAMKEWLKRNWRAIVWSCFTALVGLVGFILGRFPASVELIEMKTGLAGWKQSIIVQERLALINAQREGLDAVADRLIEQTNKIILNDKQVPLVDRLRLAYRVVSDILALHQNMIPPEERDTADNFSRLRMAQNSINRGFEHLHSDPQAVESRLDASIAENTSTFRKAFDDWSVISDSLKKYSDLIANAINGEASATEVTLAYKYAIQQLQNRPDPELLKSIEQAQVEITTLFECPGWRPKPK